MFTRWPLRRIVFARLAFFLANRIIALFRRLIPVRKLGRVLIAPVWRIGGYSFLSLVQLLRVSSASGSSLRR